MQNPQSGTVDTGSVPPVAQTPLVNPVSSVTISRRDPRMAGHRSVAAASPAETIAAVSVGPPISVPHANVVPVEPTVVENKVPLPLPSIAPLVPTKTKAESRHYGATAPR